MLDAQMELIVVRPLAGQVGMNGGSNVLKGSIQRSRLVLQTMMEFSHASVFSNGIFYG
jgi:hypothetical protein